MLNRTGRITTYIIIIEGINNITATDLINLRCFKSLDMFFYQGWC